MRKRNSLYMSLWGMISLVFFSCSKDDVTFYEETPTVYFNGSYVDYSFMEAPTASSSVVKVPVLISGLAADVDRTCRVKVVTDTNTTASPDHYKIGEGIVKAGEYAGYVPVTVNNYAFLSDSVLRLRIEVTENEHFNPGVIQSRYYDIAWTGRIVKPANWRWLSYYFGDYSTRWFSFIIEQTGRTEFPYWPFNPDKETWYWQSDAKVVAYAVIVRKALAAYNAEPGHGPMRHDDGEKAGLEVEMP